MKRLPWWVWASLALVIVLALGAGFLIGRGTEPEDDARPGDEGSAEATGAEEPQAEPEGTGTAEESGETMVVRVYLVRGEKLGVALRHVPETQAVARAAIEELLAGPSAQETGWGLTSAVPSGTKLLGLTIAEGVATVDLSGEFASGGGSLSATLRLAQVVFTLTQFSSVQRIELMIDGKPVDVFMGEGIIVDLADSREESEPALPPIFVEGPTPGERVSSPLRIWGTANTFEAVFLVRLIDVNGNTVVEAPVMATSGSGTRGTFDFEAVYPDAAADLAKVVLFAESAMDGSEIDRVEIPVTYVR